MGWALLYVILSCVAMGTLLGCLVVREIRRWQYRARGLRALELYSNRAAASDRK